MEVKEIIKNTGLSHIAIIPDGNRRWAKEHLLPSVMGHKKGVEALKNIVKVCAELNIKYLTMYAFSTENWNRKKEEVDYLMNLLASTMRNELDELHKNNVKLSFLGDLTQLNSELQEILAAAAEKTKDNQGVNLNIAINYGARDEIVHAIKNIVSKGYKEEEITEKLICENLYTKDIPDPDLLIRTSGEKRISNYLLWQIAYSELYITEKYWPEFDREQLILAIEEFGKRHRRWGK